jgi:hypothetical protein
MNKVYDVATALVIGRNVNPIVQRLAAGMVLFSQSFWGDFWLVYKNQHIVASVFFVHPEHYFTGPERFSVLVVSICVAFGLSAIGAQTTKSMACSQPENSHVENCLHSDVKASTTNTMLFSLISCALQLCYDQTAKNLVTCECVQTCPSCTKNCVEGLGKCAFWALAGAALIFLAVGGSMIALIGGDFITVLCMFVVTKLCNLMLITTIVVLVKYNLSRKAQMKPPADTLKTDKGRKRWEEPRPAQLPCVANQGPRCELWDKFIGPDKTAQDLPPQPHDYDIIVRVSLCCACCIACCEYDKVI